MKHIRPAIVLTLWFILVTGLLFPYAITAVAQATMPRQANGSMIEHNGKVIGSELIGQPFSDAKYLHPRPSAAGSGYDGNNSSGTNLGPTNPKLLEGVEGFDGIKQLSEKYRRENGLGADVVLPVDAVTRSASGLDPHVSPKNAELQVARIAKVRGISEEAVRNAVSQNTELPLVGIFGDPRVNVLKVNLQLDSPSE